MIDFSKLTMLVGPRFKRLRAERGDREKLARAHMRRAKGPKNHSTNKERSHDARAKAARISKEIAARSDALEAFKNEVRAYWRGERDTYPQSRL
jgi:hypothetical protein